MKAASLLVATALSIVAPVGIAQDCEYWTTAAEVQSPDGTYYVDIDPTTGSATVWQEQNDIWGLQTPADANGCVPSDTQLLDPGLEAGGVSVSNRDEISLFQTYLGDFIATDGQDNSYRGAIALYWQRVRNMATETRACDAGNYPFFELRILVDRTDDNTIDREFSREFDGTAFCNALSYTLDTGQLYQCHENVHRVAGNADFTVNRGGSVWRHDEWNPKTSNGLGMPDKKHAIHASFGCL